MKIALIAPTEIPARRANSLQVMKMAQALVSIGHQVVVSAPINTPSAKPITWREIERHYGLRQAFAITRLYAAAPMKRYDYSWRAIQWAKKENADVVYTRLPQAAAIASISGIVVIHEMHDMPQGLGGRWFFKLFLRGRGRRRLVVITRALAQDLQEKYAIHSVFDTSTIIAATSAPSSTRLVRLVIAPDGVDLERYHELPEPVEARQRLCAVGNYPALGVQNYTIGYSGHLYAGRGVELLLEIAQQLPEMNMFIMGGEPGDVLQLQNKVLELGLRNVQLTGFVPNADLPLYQAACNVLLMPYQQRVAASSGGDIGRYLSPMKVFEYMACQRPIISSDLPVLSEVLNPSNAIFAPGDDSAAWVSAIRRLQSDPALYHRLANQARQDVQRYTWENRAKMILEGL